MGNVEFDEEYRGVNYTPAPNKTSGLTGWLMKSGVVKNQNTALGIIFVVAVILIIVAIFIFKETSKPIIPPIPFSIHQNSAI